MALKGMDVQVWDGLQTAICNGKLELIDSKQDNYGSNLQTFICPLSHNWKFSSLNPKHLSGVSRILQHRAFSILGGQDRIVWKFNSNGNFSVNSAYWTLVNENLIPNSKRWHPKIWKALWSLKLPFKMIIFL